MLKLLVVSLSITTINYIYAYTTMPKSHLKVVEEVLSNHVNLSEVYRRSIGDMLSSKRALKSDKNNLNMNLYDLNYETFLDILKKQRFPVRRSDDQTLQAMNLNDLDHKSFLEVLKNYGHVRYDYHMKDFAKFAYSYFNEKPRLILDRNHTEAYEITWTVIRQSIFRVRSRLYESYRFKQMFENETSYHIAGIVSSVRSLMVKCDNLHATTYNFPTRTHFLFYLNVYDRILAANIDVENLVKRAFKYHRKFKKSKKNRKKTPEEIMWQELMPSSMSSSASLTSSSDDERETDPDAST